MENLNVKKLHLLLSVLVLACIIYPFPAWSAPAPAETTMKISARDGKTLVQVRDEIRRQRRGDGKVVVYLDGTFYLDKPLMLTSQDSNVTYTALNKNKPPLITSALPLRDWQEENGVWKTKVPKKINSFFVDGKRRVRARMPLSGFYSVHGMVSKDAQAQFSFNSNDLVKEWQGADLIILQKWAESIMHIARIDEAAHTVILTGNVQPWNREANARYWVENVPQGLKAPGTWYLDEKTLMLYYHPLPGENPRTSNCVIPMADQLIRMDGVNNLVFRNLEFVYADWSVPAKGYSNLQGDADLAATIQADYAENVTIEDCAFSRLGLFAVWFKNGCHNISLLNNKLYDLGAGGIKIGPTAKSSVERYKTSGNLIAGNEVFEIGNVYTGACGIMVLLSASNRIANNKVHDTYYSGISVGWSWDTSATEAGNNIIENNTIYAIGRNMLYDLGGIYTLGYQPGTVVRNNDIHNVFSFGPKSVGVGIYLDQGSSSITVENNTIGRTTHDPIFCNAGFACIKNTLRNNTIK